MSHVPHELHEEFPEHTQLLHDLKLGNAHFASLADKYHEINRSIHRIEAQVDAAEDAVLEQLKKMRLALKDQISTMLATA
jgi:uncharacterized protein